MYSLQQLYQCTYICLGSLLKRTWSLDGACRGLVAAILDCCPRGARLRNRSDASAKSKTASTILACGAVSAPRGPPAPSWVEMLLNASPTFSRSSRHLVQTLESATPKHPTKYDFLQLHIATLEAKSIILVNPRLWRDVSWMLSNLLVWEISLGLIMLRYISPFVNWSAFLIIEVNNPFLNILGVLQYTVSYTKNVHAIENQAKGPSRCLYTVT